MVYGIRIDVSCVEGKLFFKQIPGSEINNIIFRMFRQKKNTVII